jgi:hypothetical protein
VLCSVHDGECPLSNLLHPCTGGQCLGDGCCCPTSQECRAGSFPVCCPTGQVCKDTALGTCGPP